MFEEDHRRQELGALIHQARLQRGLTVTALGELVYGDSGKSNVSRVERGEIGVAPDTALKYLQHLELAGLTRRRFLELTGLAALALALHSEGVLSAATGIASTGQDILDHLTRESTDAEFYIDAHDLARPQLLWIAGRKLDDEGHWEQAQECYGQIAHLVARGSEQAAARVAYAHEFINLGDLYSAEVELGQVLSHYREAADPVTLARARFSLGCVYHEMGQYVQAEPQFLIALDCARRFDDRLLEADVLHFLGKNLCEVAIQADGAQLLEAALHFLDQAAAATRPDQEAFQAFHLRWEARALEHLKRTAEMRGRREKALWIWRTGAAPYRMAFAHVDNARTDLRAGRYREARDKLYASAELFADAKCADSLAGCLVGLAELCCQDEHPTPIRHIMDLCVSAICLCPYPHNPTVRKGLEILRTLAEADPETVHRRLMQMEFEAAFSARTARELIPEAMERRVGVGAGHRIIVSALTGGAGHDTSPSKTGPQSVSGRER